MAAYELAKAVTKVGPKPLAFSLYKGEHGDQVVIGSGEPTPQVLQEITKECGKLNRILRGICFRDGDVLVFATKLDPVPQWKTQITAVLKARHCQGVSKIDLRKLGEGESDTPGEHDAGTTGESGGAGVGGKPTTAGALGAEWEAAYDAAVDGVQKLTTKLKATGNGDAIEASAVVEQLAEAFPSGLEKAFEDFDKATAKADSTALATARAEAQGLTEACLAYLKANEELIGLCENNAFGVQVAISQPLVAALHSIATKLK